MTGEPVVIAQVTGNSSVAEEISLRSDISVEERLAKPDKSRSISARTFSVISTAGLVYISYVGITNIASVAEEIENPEN